MRHFNKKLSASELLLIIKNYYSRQLSWAALITDLGYSSVTTNDIESCIAYAKESNDTIGAHLCETLLGLSKNPITTLE